MALDENNGSPFTMPVVPAYGGGYGGNNGMFGNGDLSWLILLLLCGWGGGFGMGGFGMGGMMWPMMMARGRGSNARRDSMGRYSSDGYSQDGEMADQLRSMADMAPDERTRQEINRIASRMEGR